MRKFLAIVANCRRSNLDVLFLCSILLFTWTTLAYSQVAVNETRYEGMLKELRCLVCQNQDLMDSHAPLAMDLKHIVYQQMADGKTDEDIRHFLVDRYGEFILFKPLVKPTTWALWFGPLLFLVVGLLGLKATIQGRQA